MDSNFTNENDPWEYSLDIDDSDLHLTLVLRSSSSAHVEPSPYTPKSSYHNTRRSKLHKENVVILDPDGAFTSPTQEYMQKVLRVGDDADFNSGGVGNHLPRSPEKETAIVDPPEKQSAVPWPEFAGAVIQKDIVTGVEAKRLAEDCCRYGTENVNVDFPLTRAVVELGTSYTSIEDKRETMLEIFNNQPLLAHSPPPLLAGKVDAVAASRKTCWRRRSACVAGMCKHRAKAQTADSLEMARYGKMYGDGGPAWVVIQPLQPGGTAEVPPAIVLNTAKTNNAGATSETTSNVAFDVCDATTADSGQNLTASGPRPTCQGSHHYADTPLKIADYFKFSSGGGYLQNSIMVADIQAFVDIVFENSKDTVLYWHIDGHFVLVIR
ncbi:hypothetical protein Tco_0002380 [Tanacetum coccineum]